uniref:AAA+ ATPase domain-containing protein n=1 Tax=viral metagenome TaxID=1070528 RepID=A0A6C0BCF4_9ZZZZ
MFSDDFDEREYFYNNLLQRLNSKNQTVRDRAILTDPLEILNKTLAAFGLELEINEPLFIDDSAFLTREEKQKLNDKQRLKYTPPPGFRGYGPEGKKDEDNNKLGVFDVLRDSDKTFKDVGGCFDLKDELLQVVDFLKNPEIYEGISVRPLRGVMLTGSPGTGKTLLAKALAGECECNFIFCSGSDFAQKYVGEGPKLIGNLFDTARSNSPCIIFIDEIDSFAKTRSSSSDEAGSSYDQNLNKFLFEMDGFKKNNQIIVIGATNRVEVIDPAVLRSGRMDTIIHVPLPDRETMAEIIKIHSKGKPMTKDVKLKDLLDLFDSFSGAQVESCLNDAMLYALRNGRREMSLDDLEISVDRLLVGKQVNSRKKTDKELKRTAVHEIGHALVAYFCKNYRDLISVKINKSSPKASGHARFKNSDTEETSLKENYFNHLKVLFGGRVAESIIYPEDSSAGPSQDLKDALNLAYEMIEIGFADMPIYPNKSQKYLTEIDDQIAKILTEAEIASKLILEKYKDLIPILADELLKKRSLSNQELSDLIVKNIRFPPNKKYGPWNNKNKGI